MKISLFLILLLIAVITSEPIRIPLQKMPKNANEIHSPNEKTHSFFGKIQLTVSTYGSMRLTNYHDLQYYGTLLLGSEKKPFKIVFDTGSQWMFLPSPQCDSCITSRYFSCDESLSCSYVDKHSLVNITYGKGFISANVVAEQVFLNEELFVPQQKILNVVFQKDFDGFSADGLCGMGVETFFSGDDKTNIITNLYNAGKINNQMFSFKLNREMLSSDENYSEMIIGGYDNESFEGNITFFDVVNYNYWAIGMNAAYADKDFISGMSQALIDTGTSLIVAPSNAFLNYVEILKKKGKSCIIMNTYIKCACPDGNIDDYPTLVFNFNGMNYTLEPEYYVIKYNHLCLIYLSVLNGFSDNMWILGDKFMNKYYAVFDGGNLTIGLARMKVYDVPSSFKSQSLFLILGIILAGIFVAVIGIFSIQKVCKLRRQERQDYLLQN